MEEGDGGAFGDPGMELEDEELEDEVVNLEIEDEFADATAPHFVDEETRTLAAGLSSQDEGELLAALEAMQKAVSRPDGDKVLVAYVLASPQCSELTRIWKAGPAAVASVPLMLLLYYVMGHPLGRGTWSEPHDDRELHRKVVAVKLRLDKVARSIVRIGMKDIYSHLSSTQKSRQNAALLLLSAIVRRGRAHAIEIATSFDFTLEALRKLGYPPKQGTQKVRVEGSRGILKQPTRVAFVEFALSFLSVGDPGLLRWILQKKPLWIGVLHGISKDDENTIVRVLTLMKEKVMSPIFMVPRGLQSVLFGDATLEQLARISSDDSLSDAGELAHATLLSLCTDPSHGLCPESSKLWESSSSSRSGASGGGQGRLLRLLVRLKVAEVDRHRDLLLAAARTRPKFASLYLASIPLTLEPRVSPAWFNAMSLVSELIPIASQPPSFSSLAAQLKAPLTVDAPLIRNILRSLLPSSLSRVVLNRGLLHADFMVKHACLRVLSEALFCLKGVVKAVEAAAYLEPVQGTLRISDAGDHSLNPSVAKLEDHSGKEEWMKLSQSIQDIMRASLPDPNTLVAILSSLNTSETSGMKFILTPRKHSSSAAKKRKRNEPEDGNETSEFHTTTSDKYKELIIQLWGPQIMEEDGLNVEMEGLLHGKVVQVLAAYQEALPIAMADSGFDAFKLLPDDPASLPVVQQKSLSSLLLATTGCTTSPPSKEFVGFNGGFAGMVSAYKNFRPLLVLMLCSDFKEVRDSVYLTTHRVMSSTGAFDSNPGEISLWLGFLLQWRRKGFSLVHDPKGSTHLLDGLTGTLDASLVDFLCEAMSDIGQNIYKYLDQLHSILAKYALCEGSGVGSRGLQGVSAPEFGPFIVCILEHCIQMMQSNSRAIMECSAIVLYVANVLDLLLKYQVNPQSLAVVVLTLLSTENEYLSQLQPGCSEWTALVVICHRAQLLLGNDGKISPSSFSSSVVRLGAQGYEVGKLAEALKSCHEDNKKEYVETKKSALISSLVNVPVKELVDSFPLLMRVCVEDLGGDFSLVAALLGIHEDLLFEISVAWPEMFIEAVKQATAVKYTRGDEGKLNASKALLASSFVVSETSGLCMTLLVVPFSVLFSAASSGKGLLLTSQPFSDLLQRSLQREHYQSWTAAVRLIISRLKNILVYSLEGLDVAFSVRTCFSLILNVIFPIQPGQDNSFLSETFTGSSDTISVREILIIDLLNNPHLFSLFMHFVWTPSTSSLPSLYVGDLPTDNRENKIWDPSLRRILNSAAGGAHPIDCHVLSFLIRVLELSQSMVKMPPTSYKAVRILDFHKTVLRGCKPFILKAVCLFQKEMDESSQHGVVASSALFAVSVLISYAEPSLMHDIFLSLLSTKPVKFKSSKQLVAPHILGLHFITVFMNSLPGAGLSFMGESNQVQERAADGKSANNLDIHFVYDLYDKVIDQVTRNPSIIADLCLLSFLQAHNLKQPGCEISSVSHNSLPSLIHLTPLQVLRHCVVHPNKVTGKIAMLLIEKSPLHLAEFGWLLVLGTTDRRPCKLVTRSQQFAQMFQTHYVQNQTMDLVLSDENLLALLPAAQVYIYCGCKKADMKENKVAHHIAAVYGKLLAKQLKQWDKVLSVERVIDGVQDMSLPTSKLVLENELFLMLQKQYNSSPLGQIANMLQACHLLHPLSLKTQKRLFQSLMPKDDIPLIAQNMLLSAGEDIRSCVFEAISKTSIVRHLLFSGFRWQDEISSLEPKVKDREKMQNYNPAEMNDHVALQKFLATLTSTLAILYRCEAVDQKKDKGTVLSQTQIEECNAQWLLFLEETLLIQVTDVAKELSSLSLDISQYVPLFRSSMTTLLGYRYGNISAMKACRYLTFVLFQGLRYETLGDENLIESDVLELLIGHSKFLPSLLVMDSKRMNIPHISGKHVGKGTALNSLSSILSVGGLPALHPSKNEKETADHQASVVKMTSRLKKIASAGVKEEINISLQRDASQDSSALDDSKRLELVKLLRILLGVRFKNITIGTAEVQLVPLDEVLSILLAAYGCTMNVVDQEIFLLMQEIESYGGLGFSGLLGLDYLWGEAALKRRREKMEHIALNTQELESTDELRRRTFKEDLLIDPRRCALTVLFFPVERRFGAADIGQLELASQYKGSTEGVWEQSMICPTETYLRAAAYDPAFLLPFALHGLSIGCINAEEFVQLGLLAITFASMSSAEESMRKAGYEILAKYYSILEDGSSFKGRLQIRLLMTYVKNTVTEPWQRLPTVFGVFAAEASCILMHPENYLYMTLNRYLLRAPSLNLENIPLFQVMFGSGSVQYRSDRLWMLRLLAAGLRSSLDASVYRRKFVSELLMSFHDSAMADTFSRKWVLQVLYQAATVRSYAQYLIECSGFFSWLVSVAVNDMKGDLGLQEGEGSGQLAYMALQVIQRLMSWGNIRRHFVLDNMEELSKAGHVMFKFLFRNWNPQHQDMFRRSTIRVMLTLVRASQKRKRHQTHFTLNLGGLLEVVYWVRSEVPQAWKVPASLMEDSELTLELVLHTPPPPADSNEEKMRLFKVVSWALSVSLQLESDAVEKSSIVNSGHKVNFGVQARESLFQKLLRWLAASVILGECLNDWKRIDSRHKFATCFSVVGGFNNAEMVERDLSSREIDEQLASLLLKLEGHVSNICGSTYLVPVVAAVVILTKFLRTWTSTDDLAVKEARRKIHCVLELLLSELPCPVEINSSWLWSFNSPWVLKGESMASMTDSSVQALFELETCQTVLFLFQQFLSRRETQYSTLLSHWETLLSEKFQNDSDSDPIRNLVSQKFSTLQTKLWDVLQKKYTSLLVE